MGISCDSCGKSERFHTMVHLERVGNSDHVRHIPFYKCYVCGAEYTTTYVAKEGGEGCQSGNTDAKEDTLPLGLGDSPRDPPASSARSRSASKSRS